MSNNISVLSWGSTLLVGETGVSTKKHWPVTVYKQNDHIILYRVHHILHTVFKLTTLAVIGTNYIDKPHYHMTMAMMACAIQWKLFYKYVN